MMKIYRYYRVGFLVGLLSLNVLPSCVTTKKDSFSCPGLSTFPTLFRDVKKTCSSFLTPNKTTCLTGSFVVLVVSSTIAALYYFAPNYNYTGDQFMVSNGLIIPNTTHHPGTTGWLLRKAGGVTATPRQLAHPNIDAQKIDLILNATTKNPADGFDTTISVAPFLHTTSTTHKPTKLSVKDPMLLEEALLKDIQECRFSKDRMQYWFDQGLSINAQDQKGKTLLMHAYEAEKNRPNCSKIPGARDFMKIISFLIDNKANLNLQDGDGNTILMYAAKNFDFAMISTFMGGRADPSISNKKGDTPKSFLAKKRANKPKGYSDEEIDFLTSISFEPPKEKGE